jgi:acyl carrier protein
MNIEHFISCFKEQLENENITVTSDTKFKDLNSWDSLTSMLVIGMIKMEYNKDISSKEITECEKIEDLFELIKHK